MDPLSVEERTLRMRFLLDEQLSPTLAARLHQLGHMAEHVSHVGLSGMPDHVVWRQAFERDAILVTVNAEDFISLAERYEVHAGLIILRNGELTAKEQGLWLEQALAWLERNPRDLLNCVLEVWGPTEAEIDCYELPT